MFKTMSRMIPGFDQNSGRQKTQVEEANNENQDEEQMPLRQRSMTLRERKMKKKRLFVKSQSMVDGDFQMSKAGLLQAVREAHNKNATGFKALAIVLQAAKNEKQAIEKTKLGKHFVKTFKKKVLQVKEKMDMIASMKKFKNQLLENLL